MSEPFPPRIQVDTVDGMTPEWHAAWNDFLQRTIAVRAAVLDGCVRAAQISGEFGVEVRGNSIRLTTDVPYGEVRHVPEDVRDQL